MSRSGLPLGVDDGQRPPDAHLVSDRECDFTALLAAVQELVGTEVQLWVMGEPVSSHRAPFVLRGDVACAYEIGAANDAPVVVEVGGAALCLSERTVTAARREEYEIRETGRRWLLVWIEFSRRTSIEIEQVGSVGEVARP